MDEKEGKGTLEDYLFEKVKKSGYPLEIETSNSLENEKFVVFNTQYYFDEEARQGRDIDIYALPLEPDPLDDKLLPFVLTTDVSIECKKSETHAWVFYTRPRIPMSSIYMEGQYRATVPKPQRFSTDSFEWFLQQECLMLHYDKFERIAIAYEEIKERKLDKGPGIEGKNGSSRREIFEAINQLVKFTCYEIHQTHTRTTELSSASNREFITILFPVIVFDGDLFEVFFDSGEPKLQRKNHVLLATNYRCPYCREVESFAVDIVHRSHFSEFLQVLKMHFFKTRESIFRNRDELVKKAKADRAESAIEAGKSRAPAQSRA
jgi:hypothetical protein